MSGGASSYHLPPTILPPTVRKGGVLLLVVLVHLLLLPALPFTLFLLFFIKVAYKGLKQQIYKHKWTNRQHFVSLSHWVGALYLVSGCTHPKKVLAYL